MVVAWEKGSPERSLAFSVPILLAFHFPSSVQEPANAPTDDN